MAYDKDKPASSTSLRSSNPEILTNWSALEAALNREHEFSTGGTVADQAHHKKGSARAYFQDSEPATRVDGTAFTSQDLGSLWFDSNASPDNQFNVLTATSPTWTPVSTEIIATLLASARVFLDTLGVTSDFAVNTDKFTVAGATGNTVVAGTLDVTGNIDPTTYETNNGGFLDEDDMASGAADKVASQQSIKAYTEASLVTQATASIFGARTTVDTASGALAHTEIYKAQSDGFLTVNTGDQDNRRETKILSDSSATPSTIIARSSDDLGRNVMTVPILKDDYFQITIQTDVPASIYWVPIGTGGLVKQ